MTTTDSSRRRPGRRRVANPKPSTIRTRRSRERAERGALVIGYELREELAEVLVGGGFLRPELADCRAAIEAAFRAYVAASRPVRL